VEDFAAYHAAVRWIQSNIRGPADTPAEHPLYTPEERHRRQFARLDRFLGLLHHPERRFAPIHVAGTSGKGSTAVMIASITQAAGQRTGLHIKPYLQTPLEKLLVNGRPMNVDRFVHLVSAVRSQVEHFNAVSPEGPLRYGELWVTLTFAAYAAERVDVGVVETGVGGRWDRTNVITPVVSVINRIGFDHVRSLGPTLADIAAHKAGIIKPGVPVVVAEQAPEAMEVIVEEAHRRSAPLIVAERDYTVQAPDFGRAGSRFGYEDQFGRIPDLSLPLLGRHQVANAALAIAAARVLGNTLAIDERAVRDGLATVRFPGRLERMQHQPEVLLDGAHNGQKAEALLGALRELRRGRRAVLVLGVLASHQAEDVVRVLAPFADAIVCTATDVIGKAATPPDELAELCRPYCRNVVTAPHASAALDAAIADAGPDGLVCATGSLYLVGEARERWVSEVDILRTAWGTEEDPLPATLAVV